MGCMWKNLMERYLRYISSSTDEFVEKGLVRKLELPQFQDHIKKLNAATYLRGIFDELIRFKSIKQVKEVDIKLEKFDLKRKETKMTSKEERNYFFKDFGNSLIAILEYIKEEKLSLLEEY